MAATKSDIIRWVDKGIEQNADYMIVVCDTYDDSDYPVYVEGDNEELKRVYRLKRSGNMQRVVEIYDFNDDMEAQLESHRAWVSVL